jgi:hypothetical protein
MIISGDKNATTWTLNPKWDEKWKKYENKGYGWWVKNLGFSLDEWLKWMMDE